MHQCDGDEVFSDIFARKKNPATRIDARVKMMFAFLALLVNLLSVNIYTPLAIAALCLITLIIIGIPLRLLILRLVMPLFMAGVILVTQLFLNGLTPLFAIDLRLFRLTGYEEGLAQGLVIMSRVIGGVLVLLLLTMSTPVHELFQAARWFRMPRVFMELALLIYRYIFVLADEVGIMRSAQRVRLGYRGWRRGMRSATVLGGSLVLRAYDRAQRVFEAMSARGYSGNVQIDYYTKLSRKDVLAAVTMGALLLLFYTVGQLRI